MELVYKGQVLNPAPADTGGGSQEVYSTKEQVIGTWIDGKPLYRMTIVKPNFSAQLISSSTIVILDYSSVSNTYHMDSFVNAYGCFEVQNDKLVYKHMVPGTYGDKGFYVIIPNSIDFHVGNYTGSPTFRYWITLEYTKTTD